MFLHLQCHIFLTTRSLYHEADGVIIPTIEAYDTPEALAHARNFLASTSRKLYVIGPLLSAVSGENAVRQQMSSSPKSQEIDAFMARTIEARGAKSLVYVSGLVGKLREYADPSS